MISEGNSCFPNTSQGLQMYNIPVVEGIVASSLLEGAGSGPEAHSPSSCLLYNLSVLNDKVNQVQSLVSILVSPDNQTQPESTSLALASMGTLAQEIIVTASSMIFVCQQMSLGTASCSSAGNNSSTDHHQSQQQHVSVPDDNNNGISSQQQPDFSHENCVGNSNNIVQERGQGFYFGTENVSWYNNNNSNGSLQVSNDDKLEWNKELARRREMISEGSDRGVSDIIELDASELLAKYRHYCQVCGKGFKRDANLRMHMRAHGEEYKTSAALINPIKNRDREGSGEMGSNCSTKLAKKYSCPQEGCKWNQKHAKFQPLKSMICVKNHYKRSHCPKMYVCKRCNRKQFSVLSDLKTHEKHCGDLKWQCSCGTTFSRKDKLMGHVGLFIGHSPVVTYNNPLTKPGTGKLEHKPTLRT